MAYNKKYVKKRALRNMKRDLEVFKKMGNQEYIKKRKRQIEDLEVVIQ